MQLLLCSTTLSYLNGEYKRTVCYDESMQELHVIISGRVQLVMMRDFVQRKASGLGLAGWVRNLSDGTVEVLAQGEKPALDELLRKLRRGSILSRVDDVAPEWREMGERFSGFDILY